jgi:transcription elongation factor Elf1
MSSKGRLGNGFFRYFACIILSYKINNSKIISQNLNYINGNNNINVNDVYFLDLLKLNNNYNKLNFILSEFYQNDIYLQYRSQIIQFLKDNSNDFIISEFCGQNTAYLIHDLINTPQTFNKYYDLVIHVRLEDFVQNNEYIRTEFLLNLFETINFKNYKNICILSNKINTNFEINYINVLLKWFQKKNIKITCESNDIITDFHIMINTTALICSLSTLSWVGAFISEKINVCYFPDYPIKRHFQTFKNPIENTILYKI